MPIRRSDSVLPHLDRLISFGPVAGLSEGQLLERFLARRDEVAFEALVARLGPMVLGVCRRQLRDERDVEDAFQATFLVLVRKAGAIRDRDLLGPWLYGVAHRVAVRARHDTSRRAARERPAIERPPIYDPIDDGRREQLEALDAEVRRLPEKYRAAVVLCCLEGRSCEEAAERLRCPVGTVKSRLARARERLRSRLTRRGLAPTAAVLMTLGSHSTDAADVPRRLLESTVRAALQAASRPVAATGVAALAEGVMRTMVLGKLKTTAVGLLAMGVLAAGAATLAYPGSQAAPGAPPSGAFETLKSRLDGWAHGNGSVRLVSDGGVEVTVRLDSPKALDEARPILEPMLARGPVRVLLEGSFQGNSPPHPTVGPAARTSASPQDRNVLDRLRDLEQRLDALTAALPGATRVYENVPTSIEEDVTKIRPRFECVVEKFHVRAGEKVRRGDPLMDLFSTELAAIKNECRAKSVQWNHWKRLLAARAELFKTGAVSKQLLVEAQNEEDKSRLEESVAREKLQMYGLSDEEIDHIELEQGTEKAKFTIRSPVQGVVVETPAELGNLYDPKSVLMVIASVPKAAVRAR